MPSWRATKDVSIKDDLVEEVGRMVGYDSIRAAAPLVAAAVPPANPERAFQHEVRALFADLGFTEVYNYSFLERRGTRAHSGSTRRRTCASPIPSRRDQALLRPSLLPGIVKNILENSKHRDSFRLFEIGVEIHGRAGSAGRDSAPDGRRSTTRQGDGMAGLDELKPRGGCLMPGAETATGGGAHVRTSRRAAAGFVWKGEHGGPHFRDYTRPWWNPGAPRRSTWICGRAGTERRRWEVHADPPVSFERVRSFGDLRRARIGGRR